MLNNDYDFKKEQLLSHSNKLIEAEYNTMNNSFEVLANTVFGGYIDQQIIIDDFANRDKESLYVNLKPSYRYLKSINFKQVHFHLPNNKSFLRMHKPEKYGDDLTNIRYSVDYVNTNKKFISGLEMGKVVPGFRFVYPLFDANGHIGSVETSFSVYAFARQMEKVYKIYTHFIINKDILNKKVFSEYKNNYIQSIEHEDYMLLERKVNDRVSFETNYLKPLLNGKYKKLIDSSIQTKKIFSFDLELIKDENNKHSHKLVTFLPLKNIQKQHIGYFVVYKHSEELKSLEDMLIRKYIVVTIIMLLIFILIYKELNSKEILAIQVKEKTSKIQEMAVDVEEHAAKIEEINISLEVKVKEEVEKNAQHERKLANQSKQAALGEMIGNIAHQWRQPLSAITTSATGMLVSKNMGILKDEDFKRFSDLIVKNAEYLSDTVDDFRDFISTEKKVEDFNVGQSVEKCLDIVSSSINNYNLNVISKLEDDIIISNYKNELQQAVINIFNNSKDALKEKIKDLDERFIFIDVNGDEETVIITIKDTAGGIPESIIDKVFEPYFTTKHQSQGTGLGLYITHQIVCDSMQGTIDLENIDFEYKDKAYSGAQFILKFKKNSCKLK